MNSVAPLMDESRFRKNLKRAEIYLASGQTIDALNSFLAASQANPDHVETRLKIADLHIAADRHNEARAQILSACSGFIESPKVAVQLVQRLNVVSESGIILDVIRQLPIPMWDSAKSLMEVAQQLSIIGAHEQADAFAKAAIARDPNFPPGQFIMAKMDVFFGRLEAAAEHAERCLSMMPDDPGTHWLLSRLRLPNAGQRIDRIRAAIARTQEPGALASLWYAIHNEMHDQKDFDGAWHALEMACQAKLANLKYRPEQTQELFDALEQWSEQDAAPKDGYVSPDRQAIFVIGMHRSGTTLTERIISGHSRVAAGGESYDITAALRRASGIHCRTETDVRIVKGRERYDYAKIGKEYLHYMAWRANGLPVITDKLPSNHLNVGFIARALPNAKFVRLRRDPIDVGLSNLRTLFSTACQFTYNQEHFIAYFERYEKLMQHWHRLFPGRILDVEYSQLVAEPEAMAQKIAEFCGLPFEPSMIKIEERSDAVSTASSVMMRDGIRKDRGKVWKSYEKHLQPMIKAFENYR